MCDIWVDSYHFIFVIPYQKCLINESIHSIMKKLHLIGKKTIYMTSSARAREMDLMVLHPGQWRHEMCMSRPLKSEPHLNIKGKANHHIKLPYCRFDCIPKVYFLHHFKSRLFQRVHKKIRNTNTTIIWWI